MAAAATATMHAATISRAAAARAVRAPATLMVYEALARQRLPRALHHYVAGYAEDGEVHRRNLRAFRRFGFVPEVLVDVSRRSTATTLFGVEYACPFGIAPMGFSRLVAADGDVVLARAAARARLPFVLSGASLTRMESVRAAGPTSWFQAYVPGEPERIAALVERVASAGFDTLLVTVDTAVHGRHELAARHGFRSPVRISPGLAWQGVSRPRWLREVVLRNRLGGTRLRFENMDATPGPTVFSSSLVRDIGRRDALSWSHIEAVRRRWRGRLVIKGVMAPGDAVRAHEIGADGIVVSNHGGRQIDCAVSSLEALPRIAERGLPLAILYDGGIRRGSDVLKALKLGADFVLVGRPFLQAAAVGGDEGADHALALLAAEVNLNMGLLGINELHELSRIALIAEGALAESGPPEAEPRP